MELREMVEAMSRQVKNRDSNRNRLAIVCRWMLGEGHSVRKALAEHFKAIAPNAAGFATRCQKDIIPLALRKYFMTV